MTRKLELLIKNVYWSFTDETNIDFSQNFSAAVSNIKKVSLELGGKSPLVIFHDCDMDKAVKQVSIGRYRGSFIMDRGNRVIGEFSPWIREIY